MARIAIEVGVKTTVTFYGNNGAEIKLTRLKFRLCSPMGTMGQGSGRCCQRQHQQAEGNKLAGDAEEIHWRRRKEETGYEKVSELLSNDW